MRVKLKKGAAANEKIRGWLKEEKIYEVLTIEQYCSDSAGYRIESEDSSQPVVFETSYFDIVETSIPGSWIVLGVAGATIELGPPCFGQKDFWERFFDREPEALEMYESERKKMKQQ